MALLFIDGFDHYGAAASLTFDTLSLGAYTLNGSDHSSIQAMPVLGGLCLAKTSGNSGGDGSWGVQKVIASYASGTLGVGMHWYNNSADTRRPSVCGFLSNTGAILYELTTSGQGGVLQLRNAAGTVLASGTTPMNVNTLYHIEAKLVIADSGSFDVKLNGVAELTYSGDTNATAVNRIGIAGRTGNAFSRSTYIDNLFIWDGTGSVNNDWLGEQVVYTLLPTSDTADADWTKSTGSDGYALIDNIPPVNTIYIEAAAAADESHFGMANLASTALSIKGVQTTVCARKTTAGAITIQHGVLSGGDTSLSAATVLNNGSDLFVSAMHQTDPDTTNLWAPAAVNAVELVAIRSA